MTPDRNKVLFIYLTTGNADNPDVRHWQSRESGARASVRHILHNIRKHQHAETHEVRNYNGRPLECFSIDKVSSVFLRIPDVVKGPSALQQLENGISVTSLGPAGNTFLNWDDFISTLVEIVKTEGMDQLGTTWFNAIKNNSPAGIVTTK